MNLCFLIDEDLPRSTAKMLAAAGYEALDVRDIGLRGAKDREIFACACQRNTVIVTADIGFASFGYLSFVSHAGIILLRLPAGISIKETNEILLLALRNLSVKEIANNIIVVDQRKIRIRRRNAR